MQTFWVAAGKYAVHVGDPAKAASKDVQRAVLAALWLGPGAVMLVAGQVLAGMGWIVLGFVTAGLAVRGWRRRQRPPHPPGNAS